MALIDLNLLIASTGCNNLRAKIWINPISVACEKYGINTHVRACAFLAQVGVESGGLSQVVENLNYSADGLTKVFGKYFNAEDAAKYARKPESIANRVYANRMGNGPESSGDGWRYRGMGLIQLTGKTNRIACSKALGIDLIAKPDLLIQPDVAALSAAWFFVDSGCLPPSDAGDVRKVTRLVNGGYHGYDRRLELFNAGMRIK